MQLRISDNGILSEVESKGTDFYLILIISTNIRIIVVK